MLLVALVAMLALRAAWILRRGYDTDEAQHYHVAWAWSEGRALWRDVFDNHMPLFHVLCAPLVGAVGERADALLFGRLAMVPLFLAILGATYRIGARLFGPRVGLFAAALLGCQSTFLNVSMEFRADVLWAALWAASIAVLAGGASGPRRAGGAGLLAGLAFLASIKTSRLLVGLAAAALLVALVSPDARSAWRARTARRAALAYAVGCVLPLGGLLGALATSGRLDAFVRCVVLHNLTGAVGTDVAVGALAFAGALVLLGFACGRWLRGPDAGAQRGPAVLLVGSVLPIVGAWTIWPLGSNHDFVATLPVLAPFAAAVLVRAGDAWARAPSRGPRRQVVAGLLALALAVEVSFLSFGRVVRDGTGAQEALLADVLRLTRATDRVMDAKGETVFRDRAMFPVLELVTRSRLRRGSAEDRIPEACVEGHACVAVTRLDAFPPRGRAFLEAHYVPVGPLRVVGVVLERPKEGDSGPRRRARGARRLRAALRDGSGHGHARRAPVRRAASAGRGDASPPRDGGGRPRRRALGPRRRTRVLAVPRPRAVAAATGPTPHWGRGGSGGTDPSGAGNGARRQIGPSLDVSSRASCSSTRGGGGLGSRSGSYTPSAT